MDIKEILDHLEGTLLEDIDRMSPKDRAAYYLQAKEFLQAKLQRATAAPYDHDDSEIIITVISKREDTELGGVDFIETDI